MPPPEKLNGYLEKKYKKVNFNKMVIQDMDSSLCGYFCIAFFKFMKKKKGSKTLFKRFQQLFSPNTKENDGILADFLS